MFAGDDVLRIKLNAFRAFSVIHLDFAHVHQLCLGLLFEIIPFIDKKPASTQSTTKKSEQKKLLTDILQLLCLWYFLFMCRHTSVLPLLLYLHQKHSNKREREREGKTNGKKIERYIYVLVNLIWRWSFYWCYVRKQFKHFCPKNDCNHGRLIPTHFCRLILYESGPLLWIILRDLIVQQ